MLVSRWYLPRACGRQPVEWSEGLGHPKGQEAGCGYMPNGIRTQVDDGEGSRVRTRKQRKDKKKCGIGRHHDGRMVTMLFMYKMPFLSGSVIGMQHVKWRMTAAKHEAARPGTATGQTSAPRHMLVLGGHCQPTYRVHVSTTWQILRHIILISHRTTCRVPTGHMKSLRSVASKEPR